ncbi:MAG TPA: hypothetical protein VE959_26385 [Bryobacteraceae bacterium]|nr:hypothetical protein [Bryobacteraceae bacterium]
MSVRFLCVALAGISVALAAGQDSPRPVRFGGIMISAGYAYNPHYFFDPFLWTPFYYPGYYRGFQYGPGMGDVKIRFGEKTAMVFLDGALAGRLDQLKDMWLEPGAYNLEIRGGKHRLTQRIYVLSGKTFKVTADMMNREALP